MALDLEWIGDPRRWAELRNVWDDAVLNSRARSIYATWDFLDASWKNHAAPSGHRLAAMVLWEGRRAVGTAAFQVAARHPPVLGLRRLGMLAKWDSDRPAPAFSAEREAECAAAVLEGLEAHGGAWDIFDWGWAPADHPLASALRDWAVPRRGRELVEADRPPSAVIELPETWDQYLARMPHNSRELRRLDRKLTREGPWRYEVYELPSEMERALDLYLSVEAKSWKPAEGQGIGKSSRTEAFYRDLLGRLALQGRVTVSFLRQGTEHLSAEISIRLGETTYGVQTTYDLRYKGYSPGTLIMGQCCQHAITGRARRYELLALFAEDKLRWAPVFQPNLRLVVRQMQGVRRRLFSLAARPQRREPGPKMTPGAATPPVPSGEWEG